MFAGKKSAQIREILISESAWEEMTCLFAPSQATQAFRKARPGELLTRDERYEKANQEEIRLSDVRWKHLSLDDLYALLNRMNGDKTTLQDASSREFTGNGGRRTSAAVAAQGARDTAIMCGCLERYIVWRRRNTHFSD